jgi:hypothetical protein
MTKYPYNQAIGIYNSTRQICILFHESDEANILDVLDLESNWSWARIHFSDLLILGSFC